MRRPWLYGLVISLVLLVAMATTASAAEYEPKQIRVKMDDGSVQVPFFEDYVKDVLPNEMYPSWPSETLRAGAVAARTFGWYYVEHPMNSNWDLTEWSQRYRTGNRYTSTTAAVDYTQGWRVKYNGDSNEIYARYQAETGNPTADSEDDPIVGSYIPYLRSVPDPHTSDPTAYSGMCQWGLSIMARTATRQSRS